MGDMESTMMSEDQATANYVERSMSVEEKPREKFTYNVKGHLELDDTGHPVRILNGLRKFREDGKFTASIRSLLEFALAEAEEDLPMYDEDDDDVTLRALNKCRLNRKFVDLAILTQNRMFAFPCHRAVLASSSPYFHCLLDGGYQESDQSEIVVGDLSSGVLMKMIEYAYTGKLVVNRYNAQTMFEAGLILQYPTVQEACCEFMSNQLEPENVVGILQFAMKFACEDLRTKAFDYIVENLYLVSQSKEFRFLSKETLLDLIRSDRQFFSPECLYEAAMTWIKFETESRQRFLKDFLESVSLPQMKRGFFETVVEKEPIVSKSPPECYQLIHAAKQKMEKRRENGASREAIVIFGGSNEGVFVPEIDLYDPRLSHWDSLPRLPRHTEGARHAMAALNNDLYVVITSKDASQPAELWRYTIHAGVWKRLPDPTVHRDGCADACSTDGGLYLIGDSLTVDDVKHGERYNPDTNRWDLVPPAAMTLRKSSVVECMGKIYVFGYHGDDSDVIEVQAFDPKSGQWEVVNAAEHVGRNRQFQAASMDNLIYLNSMATKQKDVYDPGWDMWTTLPRGDGEHIQGTIVMFDGCLYEMGGRDGIGVKYVNPTIERFDPNRTVWTQIGLMKNPRIHPLCVTLSMPSGK
ncbi:KLHL24 [Branchiostoma lanceolatum]|uniref:Kelch-like protein 20 n=1 Tax=Branchiostoma lanceolatum TaxID=7740 RepID=A0A8J9WGE7_BRALA|nr:KLHL24 [Branchiostoma lanceolatum]